MFVYVCPNCKYTDILDSDGGKCARCKTEYISLGLSTGEYNKLTGNQVKDLIDEKIRMFSVEGSTVDQDDVYEEEVEEEINEEVKEEIYEDEEVEEEIYEEDETVEDEETEEDEIIEEEDESEEEPQPR